MTVYQAGHAGQPGWNDCLLLDGKRPARPPTTCKVDMISRAPQAPPPPTATTKTTTAKPEEDETAESGPEVGLDEVMSALRGVLGLDTTLPSREVAHYRTKLERVLPTVDPVHYPVMHDALTTRQKDTLVSYSLVHNGVSSWVLPLRKIIESVKD